MSERRVNWAIGIAAVTLIPVVALVAGVRPLKCVAVGFDEEGWASGDEGERKETASEIERCDLLDGWPRAEVMARLGDPTSTSTVASGTRYERYFVASEQFGGKKSPVYRTGLNIAYDRAGRVTEATFDDVLGFGTS